MDGGRGKAPAMDVDAEVVIVGAGIAGLATALALRRVGVGNSGGVLVLERHAELRATGAALTILPNGWFALRALGIAHKLTSRYDPFDTSRVTNLETGATQVFDFAGRSNSSSEEVRGRQVHRKALLEALAEELPPGTIRFSSKLVSIRTETAEGSPEIAVLRLDDGTVIRAKVLIGCDGVHSAVAQWLGLSEPATSGRSSVRGLSVFPNGHGMKNEFRQFHAVGLTAGMVPCSDKDVYWFLATNGVPAEQEAGGDPAKILREVNNLARDMPADYLDVVRHSDPGNVSWAPLLYRAPWAVLTGRVVRGPVTVAGDAFHPMTPDLGQGGCSALEDAVALARAVARAATPGDGLAAYVAERRGRAAWVVAGAWLSGWVQQGGINAKGMRGYLVRLFRDWIFLRFIYPKLLETASYDCGDLTPGTVQGGREEEEEPSGVRKEN